MKNWAWFLGLLLIMAVMLPLSEVFAQNRANLPSAICPELAPLNVQNGISTLRLGWQGEPNRAVSRQFWLIAPNGETRVFAASPRLFEADAMTLRRSDSVRYLGVVVMFDQANRAFCRSEFIIIDIAGTLLEGDGAAAAANAIVLVDADGDTFFENTGADLCPSVAGPFDGCPFLDADGDTFFENTGADLCPTVAGTIDGCPDPDADGIPTRTTPPGDNCPADANIDQANSDSDGLGDWCDDNTTGTNAAETITNGTSNSVAVNATLNGGGGNDTLNAGAGNDTLVRSAGNDAINGDADRDTYDAIADTDALTVNMTGDSGTVAGATNGTDALASVEVVQTGSGNDTFSLGGGGGPDAANSFIMNAGNGNNRFNFLNTLTGYWSVAAGSGTDVLDFSALTTGITVDLSNTSTHQSINSFWLLLQSSFENVIGTASADTIKGNSADNRLEGGAGNDTLFGGSGSDSIQGNSGTDTLYGGWDNSGGQNRDDIGTDTLVADSSDVIFGGNLNNGGTGNDGNDRMEASGNNIAIYGGNYNSGSQCDGTNCNDGNDSVVVYAGGFNTYVGGNRNLNSATGNDNVTGGGGDMLIERYTNVGNDVYIGGNLNETGGLPGNGADNSAGQPDNINSGNTVFDTVYPDNSGNNSGANAVGGECPSVDGGDAIFPGC